MLDEFEFLKENAGLMQSINLDTIARSVEENECAIESDSASASSYEDVSKQSTFVLEWMKRFSVFNEYCKKICRMLDKWTFVKNRELFFEINPYLNNLQVIMRACNRYLKWIAFDKCAKPINGGPTLAGLMGGFAGDLSRLYPIQHSSMLPLRSVVSSMDCMLVRPLLKSEKSKLGHYLVHLSDSVDHLVVLDNSMTRIFATSIAEQDDTKGFLVEDGNGCVKAFIICSRQTSSLLKMVHQRLNSEGIKDESKVDSLAKHEALAAFSCTRSLFFSKPLQRMFEIFFEGLQDDLKGEAKDFALIADKHEDLVLSFLSGQNLHKTLDARSFVVMKRCH